MTTTEAALQADARRAFLAAGGTDADFETAWHTGLRLQTLDAAEVPGPPRRPPPPPPSNYPIDAPIRAVVAARRRLRPPAEPRGRDIPPVEKPTPAALAAWQPSAVACWYCGAPSAYLQSGWIDGHIPLFWCANCGRVRNAAQPAPPPADTQATDAEPLEVAPDA